MYRFQNLIVSLENDGIHFTQGTKQFILRTDPYRGEPEEEYKEIICDLLDHPKFVQINIDVVRSALEADIINGYDEAEAESRIITCVSESVFREIRLRYGVTPSRVFMVTNATAIIEVEEKFFCIGLGSGSYNVLCHEFKQSKENPTWDDMTKFTSRKHVEETLFVEKVHFILKTRDDEDTL